jgi:hypothetical protein
MARGYPDYQNPVNQVAGRLVDFSSIVTAQLGLASIDARGRLFWWDTFHEGLGAWVPTVGAGWFAPYITNAHAMVQPSCCCLPGDVGVGVGSSQIFRALQVASPNTTGVEFSFLAKQSPSAIAVQMAMVRSLVAYYMTFTYLQNTGDVWLSAFGGPYLIATLPVNVGNPQWTIAKLVINWPDMVGHHLLIGLDDYPLSAYVPDSVAVTNADCVYLIITGSTLNNLGLAQYLGHVYFTMDEP